MPYLGVNLKLCKVGGGGGKYLKYGSVIIKPRGGGGNQVQQKNLLSINKSVTKDDKRPAPAFTTIDSE